MAKKKTLQREESTSPEQEVISPEMKFLQEALVRARESAAFAMRSKNVTSVSSSIREMYDARRAQLEQDALELAEYMKAGKTLDPSSFRFHYNKFMLYADRVLHDPSLQQLGEDFFGVSTPAEGASHEERNVDHREGQEVSQEERSSDAQKMQRALDRVQGAVIDIQGMEKRAQALFEQALQGPFAGDESFIARLREHFSQLTLQRENVGHLYADVEERGRSLSPEERASFLEELQALSFVEFQQKAGEILRDLQQEIALQRGLLHDRIDVLFQSLSVQKKKKATALMKQVKAVLKQQNDQRLFALFEKLQDLSREEDVKGEEIPENADLPVSASAEEFDAPEQEPEVKKRRERKEIPSEDRQLLEAFLEKSIEETSERYGEADLVAVARVLVRARKKRFIVSDALLTRARERFSSLMGGWAPEAALAAYDEYQATLTLRGEEGRDSSADSPREDRVGPGSSFADGKIDPPVFKEDDAAMREDFALRVQDAEISPEEVEERKKRVTSILQSLSSRTLWKSDLVLSGDEQALAAMDLDAERRNYLRAQLFLNGTEEGLFFQRILVQARDEAVVRERMISLLLEVQGLTPAQRRMVFEQEPLLTSVVVEEEHEEPSPEVHEEEGSVADQAPKPEEARQDEAPSSEERASVSGESGNVPPPPSEPGPVPPFEEGERGERGKREEKESLFARMRKWTRERAREFEDTDIYRVHIKGEKTLRELRGDAPTLSPKVMLAAGIGSAAMSYFGVAFPFDGLRYLTQRHFVGKERDEISRAFHEALARRRREGEVSDQERVRERQQALRSRVESSRYLTNAQKRDLLDQLFAQEETLAAQVSPRHEYLTREVGRILEHAIRTRLTSEKVLKEAVNTSLAIASVAAAPISLFGVVGWSALRAPAYGAVSVYERWNHLTREKPDSPAGERFKATITKGFTDWWSRAKGEGGRMAQAAAFGTAARFVGMSMVGYEALGGSGISDLFTLWERKESLYPPQDSDLSGRSLLELVSGQREQVSLPQEESNSAGVSIPEPLLGDVLPDDVRAEGSAGLSQFEAPLSGDASSEIVLSPDRIPSEALVNKGDGITQVLLSGIEARPDLLRAADQSVFQDDYASALFLKRLAAKEGLLDYWVSDQAIGELAIVPTYDAAGELHISFLNPESGSAYSLEELKEMGWLTKASH